MVLKWKDKQDGVDEILAEDINAIANAVIETQEELENLETPDVDLSNYYTKEEIDNKVGDIEAALDGIKPKTISFVNGATITIEDNTSYIANEEINTLTMIYPQTDFICSFNFTLASDGDITITLPKSKYIGGTPSFANGETWELNIKNGVVVGGKVE